MNKKGFLATFWVDIVAYLLFALIIVIFYFVFAKATTPIVRESDISKLSIEAPLVSLHYLKTSVGTDINIADYVSLAAQFHEKNPRISPSDPIKIAPIYEPKLKDVFTGTPQYYNWNIEVWDSYHYSTTIKQENYSYFRIRTTRLPANPGKTTIWLPSIHSPSKYTVLFKAEVGAVQP